jgi:hypothetical protein
LQGIEYVDRNATANTEYLVRVEKDELNLPRIFFVGNEKENVTLRLRGMGQPRTLAFNDGTQGNNHDSYNSDIITVTAPGYQGKDHGFINIGFDGNDPPMNKKTLVLDNNIIVKGNGNGETEVYKHLIYVYRNATLVLRKGAVITELASTNAVSSTIYVITKTANKGTPTEINDGKVRIEGGSITNCTWGDGTYNYLIYYVGGLARWYPGSFYMAESTEDNPIVFEGNTNNKLFFYSSSKETYLLENYTDAGLTAPEVQQ